MINHSVGLFVYFRFLFFILVSTKPNHIIFKALKFLYENFIVILPVLVGLNLLFQNFSTNDITIYLYEMQEKDGYYESKFEVYNEGNPISKHELIQPLIINLEEGNAIVDFDLIQKTPEVIKVWFSKLKKSKLKVDFDLLNESESITFSVLTRNEINKFTVSSRIKNIDEVVTYHYQIKPKFYDRIGKFWIFLLFFSVITFLDAFILTSKNKKLKEVLAVINSITVACDKTIFLKKYKIAFLGYNVRFKRNVETIIPDISQVFDTITADTINEAKHKMNVITKRSVLYTLRKPYLLVSPILFIISLLVIIGSVIYYSTF